MAKARRGGRLSRSRSMAQSPTAEGFPPFFPFKNHAPRRDSGCLHFTDPGKVRYRGAERARTPYLTLLVEPIVCRTRTRRRGSTLWFTRWIRWSHTRCCECRLHYPCEMERARRRRPGASRAEALRNAHRFTGSGNVEIPLAAACCFRAREARSWAGTRSRRDCTGTEKWKDARFGLSTRQVCTSPAYEAQTYLLESH